MAGPKFVLNESIAFIYCVSLARTPVGDLVPIPVVLVEVEAPPAETRFLLYSDRGEGVESIGRPGGSVEETVALILGDCLISGVDRGVW